MPPLIFTLLFGPAPAPPDVVDAVQEIEVESSVDEASVFRLRLGTAQTPIGDWTLLVRDYFRPFLPISIRLSNPLGIPETLINGYVSRQEVSYATSPGESVLEVTGMDATLLMNLHEKVQPWPNMPDSAIAAAIFGQYGLTPRLQPTSPQLVETEGTPTQRGTDIRYLRRLARRNGFDCYVQPEPILGVDQGFFQPPSPPVGPPQAVLNVSLGAETNVESFKVRYEMAQPTTAVAAGLDTKTKAVQPALAPAALQVPYGVEGALARMVPPPVVRPADTGLMATGELQPAVQAIVDRSSWAVVAEGEVGTDVGILRPGRLLNIRGAGRVFSGSYFTTRVTHTIGRENGHMQRFEARRNAVGMTGAEIYLDL